MPRTSLTTSTSRTGPVVALYHGIVRGAQNAYLDFISSPHDPHLSDFQGFDAVLLGDVHEPFLLVDRVAYAGSLICQSHGETSYEHGYRVWEFQCNDYRTSNAWQVTSAFCPLSLPFIWIDIPFENDRPLFPEVEQAVQGVYARFVFDSSIDFHAVESAAAELRDKLTSVVELHTARKLLPIKTKVRSLHGYPDLIV